MKPSTVQIPRRPRRRNWRPTTPRLTLRGWPTDLVLVIDTATATWTHTLTVASVGELQLALAADLDRLAEVMWGGAA
jgi:hypothetical protein